MHTLRFGELQQRFAHLPPNALQLLLSQLLERRRAEAPQPAARGLTSLLEPAALSVLADASGPSVASPTSRPPAWLRPGRLQPSDPHRLLLLRPAGLLRSAQHPAAIQPQQAYARQLAHALTVRGHRYAVYCLACDRNGRYLVTGSDDRLVKVGWLVFPGRNREATLCQTWLPAAWRVVVRGGQPAERLCRPARQSVVGRAGCPAPACHAAPCLECTCHLRR